MEDKNLYERGLDAVREENTVSLGISWMFTYIMKRFVDENDNPKYEWVQSFILGKGEFSGLLKMASEIHLSWPTKPRMNFHRHNIESYKERLKKSHQLVVDVIDYIGGLRAIAEISLRKRELSEEISVLLSEAIEHIGDIARIPDEEDVSAALKKMYAFKRKFANGEV